MRESQVIINSKQCLAVSEVLSRFEFRPGFTKRSFLSHPLKKETRLRMLFFAVTVCHQTRSLKNEKLQIYGWDYIEHVFLKLAASKSGLLDVNWINISSEEDVADMLSSSFSVTGNAENSTLDRIVERVQLLKDLCRYVTDEFEGSFSGLMEVANGFLINQGSGYYEILSKSIAFADPLRKKSSFLAKLLIDSGLLQIKDTDNYVPIMDYHMQRVLLRLGCVEIMDTELLTAIQTRKPLPDDLPVRKACVDAVRELSYYSGIESWKMNDIFWSLGRSCCNETMLCIDNQCMKDPCTFQTIVLIPEHKSCSFESVCNGFGKEEARLLWEPVVETHYY